MNRVKNYIKMEKFNDFQIINCVIKKKKKNYPVNKDGYYHTKKTHYFFHLTQSNN